MISHRALCVLAIIVGVGLTTGCGSDESEDVPIAERDAGSVDPIEDAGEPDARAPIEDAGVPDLGVADAGVPDMRDAQDLGHDAGQPIDRARFEPLIEAIERDLSRNLATSASVAVWLDDQIVYVGGFGTVDPEIDRAPDEDTMFMIGSDTKKIASLMYLQETERDPSVSVMTTVGDVLPTLRIPRAPDFSSATAHELMSHTGGLNDYLGTIEQDTEAMHGDAWLRDHTMGGFAQSVYAMSPPGAFFNYSNPNFSILGLMTETLAGKPWADLATERVFAPLGMDRTVARRAEVDANHAIGVGVSPPYGIDEPARVPLDQTWEDAFVRPAGLVWSTPTDQIKLARFLVDGDEAVLSDALRAQLSTAHVPQMPDGLQGASYGYGLMILDGANFGQYVEVPLWAHGGNTLTHTSTFYVLPTHRFAISILSNGRGDSFGESAATAVITLVEDLPEPSAAPVPPFEPSKLDALTGSYMDPNNVGRVQVTREGDTLRVEMPDLEQYNIPYDPQLRRVSTHVWVATIRNQDFLLSFYTRPLGPTYIATRYFVATKEGIAIGGLRGPLPSREAITQMLQRAAAFEPLSPPRKW